MRLTGGADKGRLLVPLRGQRVRPTSSIIREALFNILPPVEQNTFLDLFAGSGIVGLEALSRGAASATFVERSSSVASELQKNIRRLDYARRGELLNMEATAAITLLTRQGRSFDIVFLDPPYDEGEQLPRVMSALGNAPPGGELILRYDGFLVVQHSIKEPVPLPRGFALWKERDYGVSRISIFVITQSDCQEV